MAGASVGMDWVSAVGAGSSVLQATNEATINRTASTADDFFNGFMLLLAASSKPDRSGQALYSPLSTICGNKPMFKVECVGASPYRSTFFWKSRAENRVSGQPTRSIPSRWLSRQRPALSVGQDATAERADGISRQAKSR
jgi:hypothetical protein